MDEGLVTVDAQGRITLCNEAARTLLDTRDGVAGRSVHEILVLHRLDGTLVPSSSHPVRRALTGQRVPWDRLMAPRPTGGVPLAVAASPLVGPEGPNGALVLLRDVRAEIEMERLRDDFFFIASHELRTPLTIMKGNLEIAAETAPEGVLRQTIGEALASVLRLIRMVNDYLDAARLEHGTLSMHVEDGSLADLARQAVETIRPDAERKGLEVLYREAPGLPAVRLDLERTLQILLNLLGNSLRYTSQGRIEVWHEVQDGAVETLVRDTGPGIAPEHHARLFTRFGQVERGLTRASGGSGLGLYISQKLAEQMGGAVVLKHSAPGQGSTFALRLSVAGRPGR
jgi:signal transduction histidine kinase